MLVTLLVASVYWDLPLLAFFLPPQVVPYPCKWALGAGSDLPVNSLQYSSCPGGTEPGVIREQICGKKKALGRLNNSLGRSARTILTCSVYPKMLGKLRMAQRSCLSVVEVWMKFCLSASRFQTKYVESVA
jgi:hypothetical protein